MRPGSRRFRWLLGVLGVLVAALGATPPILLWRAGVTAGRFERESRRTGRPIESALPSVLARIAAVSPPFSATAHRQEAGFWLTFARAGERTEAREGATRRLSTRIARAYSDAIRADAGFSAARAVPALVRRSRFDLAGRRRGRDLERSLRDELALARWLSGTVPRSCDQPGGVARWTEGPLAWGPGGSTLPGPSWRDLLDRSAADASIGRDDRALSLLDDARAAGAPEEIVESHRGLLLLRRGDASEAERRFRAVARGADGAVLLAARAGRAVALLGLERPDEALYAISVEPGHPAFAMVRLIASFVTGDTSGARVALRRIPRDSTLGRLRDELDGPLVLWSAGRRKEARAELSRLVARDPRSWDFLLPLARWVAGRADDVDAWLELSRPQSGVERVWQLYALERAARERGNAARADELRSLRRRICN